jgi:hypothetical protein
MGVRDLRVRLAAATRGELQRHVLVTGCGGSGTTYLSQLLTLNGVRVTHDFGLGRDGIVTNACDGHQVWIYSRDDEDPKGFDSLNLSVQDFTHIVHVVRDPLQTIGSVFAKWQKYGSIWPHVREGLTELREAECTPRAAALYWLRWNELIEGCSTATHRFEDLLRSPQDLFDSIGRRFTRPLDSSVRVLASGATWYPTWQELRHIDERVSGEVRQLAARYGYEY